ncbi:MAG: formylmethanofuran dehydrogenase subunit B [Methanotrichaceae archaeon]
MTFKNIICPVCGASCDDIQVDLAKEKDALTVKNACKMGNAKFQEIVSAHRIREPMLKVGGDFRNAAWDEAIQRAAEILAGAKRPLIFMGSETSCEAMEVGLHLGEYLGAIVDSNSTVCHGPTAMGIQEAGRVGATAGQSKNRADLAVYWGSNPLESMPRHMSRYAIYPRGYWTRRGRFDRKVITVDPRKSITARNSDLHVQLKPNTDHELISALLTLLHGKKPHTSVESITGVKISEMEMMLEMMKNCNYGVIYVGLGIASSFGKHRNTEAAFNLVKELNTHTKFVIGALRGHCNVAGFNQIASYLYGYPFGLDFARGYPRYNPGEYTAVDVLREKDVDAALIVSADLVSHFPAACAEFLAEIPVACIDIAPCPTTMISDVVLPGVIDAMECDGTFYRLDDVPVYFQPFTESPFPFTKSNEDTMNQIFERVKRIK